MKLPIADALESKKFLAFLATLIVVLGNKCVGHWGYELDASQVALLVGSAATYMLGQGIADHGKSAAQTNAAVAAAIAMEPSTSKDAALKTLASFAGTAPVAPPPKSSQAGFARLGLLIVLSMIGAMLLFGCASSARQKTLAGTLAALDSAEVGLVTFNQQYQDEIVKDAPSVAEGHAKLVDFRAKRDAVAKALAAAYTLLQQAFTLDNDPSMQTAVAAAVVVVAQLKALGAP